MGIFKEDEGTDGIMMQVAWKCEAQSQDVWEKHWVWMQGMGRGTGDIQALQGVFSCRFCVGSSQTAVSQTDLWLCFLQVKADKHCLWHGPHSNRRNGTWSRWVTGCARLQESYLLLMSLQKCHYRDRLRWGYSCCCRTSVLLAFCRAGCQGNSQMSVQCLML